MQILFKRPLQERRRMPFHPFEDEDQLTSTGTAAPFEQKVGDRTTITSTKANQGIHHSKITNTTEEARQSGDSSEVNGSIATITTEETTQSGDPAEGIGIKGLLRGKDIGPEVCQDGRRNQGSLRRF